MNAKTLLLLFLLAGLAALGAWFIAFRPAASTPVQGDTEPLLAPAVRERAGEIRTIEIERGDDAVTVERDGDRWVVASLGGYPAEEATVRRIVTTLSELRILERKTARPEFHGRLALQWPDSGETGAEPGTPGGATRPTLIRLADADGEPIAAVVLGETTFVGTENRQYARLLGEDQTYLATSRVDAPASPMRWINARFIELPRESVERVTITHPTGETVSLSRGSAEDDFAVENVPEGMEPISEGLANRVGNALAFVNFTEVRRADAGDESGTTEPVTAVYETFDGLTITLVVHPIVQAAGVAEVPADGAWVEASAEGEGAEPYTERFDGWTFRLPQSATESLTRKPEDLLRPVETDEAGPAAPADDVPELLRAPDDG